MHEKWQSAVRLVHGEGGTEDKEGQRDYTRKQQKCDMCEFTLYSPFPKLFMR